MTTDTTTTTDEMTRADEVWKEKSWGSAARRLDTLDDFDPVGDVARLETLHRTDRRPNYAISDWYLGMRRYVGWCHAALSAADFARKLDPDSLHKLTGGRYDLACVKPTGDVETWGLIDNFAGCGCPVLATPEEDWATEGPPDEFYSCAADAGFIAIAGTADDLQAAAEDRLSEE